MNVVIRADAYPELGTGHVMRCLALGQGIKDSGGKVVFVTYCESEALLKRLEKEDFAIHTLSAPGMFTESLEIIDKERPDWVVLDGYNFDSECQKAVKDAEYRLLYIDDYAHLDRYYADIILNQNYGAEKFHYNAESYTKILAGTDYVLLRREFINHAAFKRDIPDVARKVLITLGGVDLENNTLKVMKALNLMTAPLEMKVVIGAGNPHYESVNGEADISSHKVEILRTVENMAPLMEWADIAISAGGTTIWELAFMGLPSLICIVAENQENAVTSLFNKGTFKSTGWIKDRTVDEIYEDMDALTHMRSERESMCAKEREMVDGRGIHRILESMFNAPLNILFLGGTGSSSLSDWLKIQGEKVYFTEDKIDADTVTSLNPDMIISYNYRHILNKNIIDIPARGSINLHISYLPWNRGAQPNLWSFIEDTPKGVTIHLIDEGIDTGDILIQKKVVFDEEIETLGSSYKRLHSVIQNMFKEHWKDIKSGKIEPRKQSGEGSLHYIRDASFFEDIIRERGWGLALKEFKMLIKQRTLI